MSLRLTPEEAGRLNARSKPDSASAPKKASRRSKLETDLHTQLRRIGLPEPCVDYRFHGVREWKFDFAWPAWRVAIEVDGTLGPGGTTDHQSTSGMTNDHTKTAEAMLLDWLVLHVTSPMVKDGQAACYALRLLTMRGTDRAPISPALRGSCNS